MTAGLNPVPNVRETQLEDPLAYLPCSSILERRKGQVIYNEDQASTGIYLVLQGKVKVSHHLDGGRQVVIDIYHEDDFFGESGFLNLNRRGEEALALETSRLMAWTTAEIEDVIMRRPRLGVALLQLLAQRSIEFAKRIDSFSSDKIEQRLARALVRFSERLGERAEDGAMRMCPFTHELLSQYVGTSREIITHYMNVFRTRGCVRYSRKGIEVYADALKDWLRTAA